MPLNLEGCSFILTFKCVARCAHCPYRASPLRKGVMEVSDFREYMKVLADKQSLKWITFCGGEPFLFYKTLKRCVEIARKLGQREIGISTSGHWGGNQTNARKRLLELRKAGLTSICFSVDAFHQKTVPFRSVHTAVNAARASGLEEITVTSRFLNGFNSENMLNSKTEEYIERLHLPDDARIERITLEIGGRAADELRKFVKCKAGIPRGRCRLPAWAGKTLKDPKAVSIDLLGNVTICPGICIGNAKTGSLLKLIQEYDYKQNRITKLLVEDGPHKLSEICPPEFTAKPGQYADECHLCYELRKPLRTTYPELLAPENCYEE